MSIESLTVELTDWQAGTAHAGTLTVGLGPSPDTAQHLTVTFPATLALADLPRHIDLQLGLKQVLLGIPEAQFRIIGCRLLETEPYRLCITLYAREPVYIHFKARAPNTT